MPRIVLKNRLPFSFVGDLQLLLDGGDQIKLKHYQVADFQVPPGIHVLQARSGDILSEPLEFRAAEGESIVFDCLASGLWQKNMALRVLYHSRPGVETYDFRTFLKFAAVFYSMLIIAALSNVIDDEIGFIVSLILLMFAAFWGLCFSFYAALYVWVNLQQQQLISSFKSWNALGTIFVFILAICAFFIVGFINSAALEWAIGFVFKDKEFAIMGWP